MTVPPFHPFRDWPAPHRRLLWLAAATAVLALVAYFLLLHPRYARLADALNDLRRTEKKLKDSPWPRDADRLESTLKAYNAEIGTPRNPGLRQLAEDTLFSCSSIFADRIHETYDNDENFLAKASQIEYKDQYDRLESALRGHGVFLDGGIFGLDQTTSEPQKYQMILKLWTTELAVNQALAHRLHIGQGGRSGRQPKALITALPIRSYVLEAKDAAPYLLEIPVRFTVVGSMEDFLGFCQSLQSDEFFLPLTQLELSLPPPQAPSANSEAVTTGPIIATVVCSAFYRPLSAKLPAAPAVQRQQLPPGA